MAAPAPPLPFDLAAAVTYSSPALFCDYVGWALVALGVIGWFLPILQGWLTLFMGLAVLSLASQRLHAFLRERFRRWPRGWRRLEKFRRRVTRWLERGRATRI